MLHLKRAYEDPKSSDGYRVLVERLWPRGVKKEALELDDWMKDVAPSTELRQWYGHDVDKWREFQERYRKELSKEPAAKAVDDLADRAKDGRVTLVYAAADEEHNSARVLCEVLERRLSH
jgi:uncharacterized protein YeaO (DUF488 family)